MDKYLGEAVTNTGVGYSVFNDKDGKYYTEDIFSNSFHENTIDDLMKQVEKNGWVDQMGNFRLGDHDCEFYKKHWLYGEGVKHDH